MEKIERVIFVLSMCILSVSDIRTKAIDIRVFVPGILWRIIRLFTMGKVDLGELLLFFTITVVVYVFALCREDILGRGDALAISYVAMFLGVRRSFFVVVLSFMMVAFIGGIKVMFFGKSSTDEKIKLPYVPFLFLSVVISEIIYYGNTQRLF